MEPSEQTLEPDRARAAFNMVALHLAGYTFSQIELFHPSNMTAERLHELLDRKAANLLGEWAAKQDLKIEPTSKAELAQKDRRD
jgi:divalent metal cation (Fe/Co/Zn/Cd) transporter